MKTIEVTNFYILFCIMMFSGHGIYGIFAIHTPDLTSHAVYRQGYVF